MAENLMRTLRKTLASLMVGNGLHIEFVLARLWLYCKGTVCLFFLALVLAVAVALLVAEL